MVPRIASQGQRWAVAPFRTGLAWKATTASFRKLSALTVSSEWQACHFRASFITIDGKRSDPLLSSLRLLRYSQREHIHGRRVHDGQDHSQQTRADPSGFPGGRGRVRKGFVRGGFELPNRSYDPDVRPGELVGKNTPTLSMTPETFQ